MPSLLRLSLLAFVIILAAGCAGPAPYRYVYVPGKTAELRDGYAVPPPGAPEPVLAAIAAGNRITGLPYSYGAGHGMADMPSSAYDCSGAVSYVLRSAGMLKSPLPSRAFRKWGESGQGRWISVYARRDHVFLVVAGLRFDTGWNGTRVQRGPRWTTKGRPTSGSVVRHPHGY